MHEHGGRQQVAQEKGGHDPRGLADRAPLAHLAVGVAAELARPALAVEPGLDLPVAVAVDEGAHLVPAELLAEPRRQGPEVGEEGAGVASHEAAGQGDRGHARQAGEPVGGLGLGRGGVREFVELVQLCGAPHKLTNGERSVMWSGSRTSR